MTISIKRAAAILFCALGLTAAAQTVQGSAFVAWRIAGVAGDDLLNVRAFPSSGSRIIVGYPEGTTLSMTGRCTGGVDLQKIGGKSAAKQRQAVRFNWCETYLDPDGDGEYESGWVYGRYITPE